jgi:hypothetical protein
MVNLLMEALLDSKEFLGKGWGIDGYMYFERRPGEGLYESTIMSSILLSGKDFKDLGSVWLNNQTICLSMLKQ